MSTNGSYLLRYSDLNLRPDIKGPSRRTPLWFNLVERYVLNSPTTSRKVLQQWQTVTDTNNQISLDYPDLHKPNTKDWIVV